MWLDDTPPLACPYDEDGSMSRGPMKVRSVTDCPYQMTMARQRAEMMKACPEAFDGHGNMRPGGLAKVMKR